MRDPLVILLASLLTPALFLLISNKLPDGHLRKFLGPLSLVGFISTLFAFANVLDPLARLYCCSVWLLCFVKGWALLNISQLHISRYSRLGLFIYSYGWPGVDPTPFAKRCGPKKEATRWFAFGFPTMCCGIGAIILLTLHSPSIPPHLLGLAVVLSLLTTIHLGFSDVLSCAVQFLGYPVERLFVHPLAANSLRNFWSHRWNRPFVEMNKLLFRPLLAPHVSKGTTVFVLFLISGLLHELALSFPPGSGFGGPLAYFAVQGLGMVLQSKGKLSGRIITWAWLLIPVPLLFQSAFLTTLVLPLVEILKALPPLQSTTLFWNFLLTFAAYGHFLVLVASFQVPYRLNWGEELQRLRPLNRKLLWTYGAYIASMILLWGLVTLYLKAEILSGEKSALVLTALIALFWWSRIIIDALYFEHSDWPEGPEFVLGHTCLTTLFVTLAGTYTAVLVSHVVG